MVKSSTEDKAQQDALAQQAAINDPSVVPAEDKSVEFVATSPEQAYEQGYFGASAARAAAGGADDKGLSQQSILKG